MGQVALMVDLPTHRNEHTGDVVLDRIQGNVRDVIAYLRSLVWLANRAYAALATDTGTIAAGAYATLLIANITTTLVKSFLLVSFTASGVQVTTLGTAFFQVLVDGAVVKGTYTTVAAGSAFAASMVVRVPVSKGAHSVALQWKTSVANARINASTVVEEHAHLYVEEVTA